jgi:hypothetical protein
MSPIIDPRQGDFEDDASSTKRRSLWTLAGSLLVEISLPKLALAWFLMLVVPSLALGLAPIAASAWLETVTWKIFAAFTALYSALLLAVMVAVGWYAGRPLFRLAMHSFWALNSLAVEPMYLIVREALRYLDEKRLPTEATQEQYARGRARAAAVAGVGICGAALVALAIAWPHTRWSGTMDDLKSPLRLAPVAWANSTVLVSAYLAVVALAWGMADSRMAQPRTTDRFPAAPPNGRTWRVAHLSDPHVVGERFGFRLESGRSGPRGNERLRAVWARLEAIHARQPLDVILVSGDMTDAGRSAEWAEFLDTLAPHPQLAQRVLLLPGNHDLNVADRSNPARLELPTSPNRRLRQLRVLSMLSNVQGGRARVVDHGRGLVGHTLADALAPRLDEITRFADTGRPWLSRSLAQLWNDVFPLVVPPDADDGLGVILLNSNIDSQFSFTSALGLMPGQQVRGIQIAAGQYPRARWLIALHHHLVEYPRAGHALSDRIGIALINGNWFVRRLRPLGGRAVVMHGHRHVDWIGECEGLSIVSAPSPVMEATDAEPTSFYIHTLAAAGDGGLWLLKPERIVVEPARNPLDRPAEISGPIGIRG